MRMLQHALASAGTFFFRNFAAMVPALGSQIYRGDLAPSTKIEMGEKTMKPLLVKWTAEYDTARLKNRWNVLLFPPGFYNWKSYPVG